MAIIDQILEYLKKEGLQPVKEDFGIIFKYQMITFIILDSEDDEYFLRIIMPGIMDVDANNRMDVLDACNKVTAGVKIAKAYINDGEDVITVLATVLAIDAVLDSQESAASVSFSSNN